MKGWEGGAHEKTAVDLSICRSSLCRSLDSGARGEATDGDAVGVQKDDEELGGPMIPVRRWVRIPGRGKWKGGKREGHRALREGVIFPFLLTLSLHWTCKPLMINWRPHGDSNPGYCRERAVS